MQADTSSCVCPGCGVVCRGRFAACPQVWENLGGRGRPVTLGPRRPATMNLDLSNLDLSNVELPPLDLPPLDLSNFDLAPVRPADERVRADNAPARVTPAVKASVVSHSDAEPDPAPRKPKDANRRLRPEVEVVRSLLERSYNEIAAEMAARAREIDARAAAHLRAIEHDRDSLPAELQQAGRQNAPRDGGRGRPHEPGRPAGREAVTCRDSRGACGSRLRTCSPGLVADAVRLEIDARPGSTSRPGSPRMGPGPGPTTIRSPRPASARWRSGSTASPAGPRRSTTGSPPTSGRSTTTGPRSTDVTRHQDAVGAVGADAAGHHDQLVGLGRRKRAGPGGGRGRRPPWRRTRRR